MRPSSYRIEDLKHKVLEIGYEGENNFRQFVIDCGKFVFNDLPDAVPTMVITSPAGDKYPKDITRNGNCIVWTVTNSDLTAEGDGEFQITFTEGEEIAKSFTARFHVCRSIIADGEAPDPVQDWINDATEKLAAVEQATQEAEAAANHQPYIGIDGYWYTWNGEEFVKNVKAQGDKGDPGDPGSPGDPTELIDDTSTGLNKTWSASKQNTVLSALQVLEPAASAGDVGKFLKAKTVTDGKVTEYEFGFGGGSVSDVKVNNVSVLDGTVAKIPLASSSAPGVVKVNAGGLQMVDDTIKIAKAQDSVVKAGTVETAPIVPSNQHLAAFYGFAKAAGDTSQASSANAVGSYTDDAKIKIQKMLGIYEAPWELIREDSVTNATDANIEITVDGNGNPFELTDVRLLFCSPVQETQFVKGDYGKIKFGYGTGNDADSLFIGAYTQAANAARKISYCEIEQKNGMIKKMYTQNATNGGNANIQTYINDAEQAYFTKITGQRIYNKVIITNVTGTATYKLYGKRKWN